jgi:hypothetical protein
MFNQRFGFTRPGTQNIAATWAAAFNNLITSQPDMTDILVFVNDHSAKPDGAAMPHSGANPFIQTVGVALGANGAWGLTTFAPHGMLEHASQSERVDYMNSSSAVMSAIYKLAAERNVEATAIHFNSALVDTVGLDPKDPDVVRRVLLVLLNRAESSLQRVLAEREKEPLPGMINFNEARGRVVLEQNVSCENPALRDLLGKIVRNDYVFTLTVKEAPRRDSVTKPVITTLLKVSGYVDFKRAPVESNPGQPWNIQPLRYLPEFIITDIDNGSGEITAMHEQQATVFAIAMVADYMRAGRWTERYMAHLKTHSEKDLTLLFDAPQREVFIREKHQNGYAAMADLASKILSPGFLLSIDIPENPTGNMELKTLSEVVVRQSTSIVSMFNDVAASLGRDDYYSRYGNTSGHGTAYLTPVMVPMGSMVVVERAGTFECDVRQMDTLHALHVCEEAVSAGSNRVNIQKMASKYLDLFYLQRTSNGHRGQSGPSTFGRGDHMAHEHAAFLKHVSMTPEYYNVAHRTTFNGQFVNLAVNLLGSSGLDIRTDGQTKALLTADHQAIVL